MIFFMPNGEIYDTNSPEHSKKVKQIMEDGLEIDDIIRRAKSSAQLSDCNNTDYRYRVKRHVEYELNVIIERRQYVLEQRLTVEGYFTFLLGWGLVSFVFVFLINYIIVDLLNLDIYWTIIIVLTGLYFILKRIYEKVEFDKNDFAEKAFVDGVKAGSKNNYIANYLDLLYRLESSRNIDWLKDIK